MRLFPVRFAAQSRKTTSWQKRTGSNRRFPVPNTGGISRQYFERIERSNARIEKARALLRASAEESRRKKQQTPPIPPALKLELETEAIVSQIERETDAILLAQTPEQKEPRSQEEAQQLKAVAAPPEECAFENDCNIPWE